MSTKIIEYPNGVYTLKIEKDVTKINLTPSTSNNARYYNHCTWRTDKGVVLVEWQIQLSTISVIQNPMKLADSTGDVSIITNAPSYNGSTLTFTHRITNDGDERKSLLQGTDLTFNKTTEIIQLNAEDKNDTNFMDFSMTILYR